MYELDGRPRIGDTWGRLGVRPPGRVKPDGTPALGDVDVDANGDVALNQKGMSVIRSLADVHTLMKRLVPIHLAHKVRGAAGPADARIWTMGQGRFASGSLTNCLELIESGGVHGSVCPSIPMSIGTLQQELANTHDFWTIEEP